MREEKSQALREAFNLLDTNRDGSLSVEELRQGLSNQLSIAVTVTQASDLMKVFDESGDGELQFEEFQGLEPMKRKLEILMRNEEAAADKARAESIEAKRASLEAKLRSDLISEYLNESPPTLIDRVVSVLPYALPFVDSLQYGRFIVAIFNQNPFVESVVSFYKVCLANFATLGGHF